MSWKIEFLGLKGAALLAAIIMFCVWSWMNRYEVLTEPVDIDRNATVTVWVWDRWQNKVCLTGMTAAQELKEGIFCGDPWYEP